MEKFFHRLKINCTIISRRIYKHMWNIICILLGIGVFLFQTEGKIGLYSLRAKTLKYAKLIFEWISRCFLQGDASIVPKKRWERRQKATSRFKVFNRNEYKMRIVFLVISYFAVASEFFIQRLLYFFIAAGCVVTLTGGCIPGVFRDTINEPFSGRIVDSQGRPIPGIHVISENGGEPFTSRDPDEGLFEAASSQVILWRKEDISDAEGRFAIDPIYFWFYLTYVGDPGCFPYYDASTTRYTRLLIQNGDQCYGIFDYRTRKNDGLRIYRQRGIDNFTHFLRPMLPPVGAEINADPILKEPLQLIPREFLKSPRPLRIELEPELILLLDEGF